MWIVRNLVSLEGIDQTGKTQMAEAIHDALAAEGLLVASVTDPPHFPPWDRVKEEWFDKANELSKIGEAWMFLSARLDMVQREIVPALADGAFVVADRYVDSWVAYHAPNLARTFGSLDRAVEYLRQVHLSLSRARLLPLPRRTWLIRDDPRRALRRKRGPRSKWENLATQEAVAAAYALIQRREPRRVVTVDVGDGGLDAVQETVVTSVVRYCLKTASR